VSLHAEHQRRFGGQPKDVAGSLNLLSAAQNKRATGLRLHPIKARSDTRIETLAGQASAPLLVKRVCVC